EGVAFLLVTLQAHDFIEYHFFHHASSATSGKRRRGGQRPQRAAAAYRRAGGETIRAPHLPLYSVGSFLSPSGKRPACDFSARARVSNHSATSSKPSLRAVLAKPGYISVYS